MESENTDIVAGIQNYTIDEEKWQMTIGFVVSSKDHSPDKYTKVCNDIKNLLANKYPSSSQEKDTSQRSEQMETIQILEDEINTLRKSIESGADGWETTILLHEKFIKCIELHAKINGWF